MMRSKIVRKREKITLSFTLRWAFAWNLVRKAFATGLVLLASRRRYYTNDSGSAAVSRVAIFVINLLQDVSVLRPLVFLARECGWKTELLVSAQFRRRDLSGLWLDELNEICEKTNSQIAFFKTVFEARRQLEGKSGLILAGSESNLAAHSATHDVFRVAPRSFVKITMQHGYECVGFLHNNAHNITYGDNVTFAADILCGWCAGEQLTAMAPAQKAKLYVSGPPLVLHQKPISLATNQVGLVCENLHSVRLNVGGNFKTRFISTFNEFCTSLEKNEQRVVLRPHPGGQYVVRNKSPLRPNVILNNEPIYKLDLRAFSYGISAPSSVLIDMMLAGIPVAVWRDEEGEIDADNYRGIAEVRSVTDWVNFAHQASMDPKSFIEKQRAFLDRQQMLTDASEVRQRFVSLFSSASYIPRPKMRILFVASGKRLPTLEINFILPLQKKIDDGELVIDFITEEEMRGKFGKQHRDDKARKWIVSRLLQFRPEFLVFCRYSGPHAKILLDWAREEKVPVVYHIDDDLLNVPLNIVGRKKFDYHNDPQRLTTVKYLLGQADLVYCSTVPLAEHLRTQGVASAPIGGSVSCSGRILVPARNVPVKTIGYMGFDHAHDLKAVLPSLVTILRGNSTLRFELFGAIPKPRELDEFGDRIGVLPIVKGYEEFLEALARREWQVGICPLAALPFNSWKSINKWIEYTAVGAAVVATADTIYDGCCAGGCGLLAKSSTQWTSALERLVQQPHERFALVKRAQDKLEKEYPIGRLRDQVFSVLKQAEITNEKKCSAG